MSSPDARVRLAEVSDSPIRIEKVLAELDHPAAGGVALFVGVVRNHDAGKDVAALRYSAHPSAAAELARVAQELLSDDVLAMAVQHRVGELAVGETAVVTAVACAHRAEALAINARLIDRIKSEVPVWKHQIFTDGTEEWVGL